MSRYYFSDNAPGATIVYEAKGGGGSSLGAVWAHVGRGMAWAHVGRGMACVSILREQADGSLVRIATRGCGGPWELVR